MTDDPEIRDAFDAEQAVLGALMLGGDAAFAKVESLKPEHMTDARHRWLFSVLLELHAERTPCDAVTVAEVLERRYPKRAVELAGYVLEVANGTPGSANIGAYAAILARRWNDRRVREIASALIQSPDGVEQAIRDLMALHGHEVNREHTMAAAVKEAVLELTEAVESGGKLRGITTGFASLDRVLGGFHRGDLVIIGARPAMGKTALLLSMAQAADVPRGFVSAEQSVGQIGQRAVSMATRIPVQNLRAGRIDETEWPRISAGISILSPQECVIYDKPAPTLAEVVRVARRWKLDRKIQALYVDYVQRIKHGNPKQPRHERVGEVAEGLKELARELDIPVIALAQVNRAVEERHNKRPNMGDLSDSSALEKEADQVMMLYRDEVYNEESEAKGTAELILEKNRHGGIGKVVIQFNAPTVTFSDREAA